MRAMEIKMWQNKRWSNEQNNSLALVFRTLFMLKLSWPNNKDSNLAWSVYRNTDRKLFHFQDGTQRHSHTLYWGWGVVLLETVKTFMQPIRKLQLKTKNYFFVFLRDKDKHFGDRAEKQTCQGMFEPQIFKTWVKFSCTLL